jgi:hypothetical protein
VDGQTVNMGEKQIEISSAANQSARRRLFHLALEVEMAANGNHSFSTA